VNQKMEHRWKPLMPLFDEHGSGMGKDTMDKAPDFHPNHCRFFRVAGITVCVESNLDLTGISFKDELVAFAVDGPGDDTILLRHHFGLPDITGLDLGKKLYEKAPWAIYNLDGRWIYKGIVPMESGTALHSLAVFNADHTRADIYHPSFKKDNVLSRGFQSLSLFPTDQVWLSPLLAYRNAVLLHSGAAIVNGRGLIFVGHSEAGKSTTMELLKSAHREKEIETEILCDDRNVIRRRSGGWQLYGSWSHGDVSDVSSGTAPLKAIYFLEQAGQNRIMPLIDRKMIWRRLLATLIRSLVTAEWWQKQLDSLEQIIEEVPCYLMRFDKSGAILPELKKTIR